MEMQNSNLYKETITTTPIIIKGIITTEKVVAASPENAARELRAAKLAAGTIIRVIPAVNDFSLTASEFLVQLKFAVPEGLTQTLSGEYLLGAHGLERNYGFLLLSVRSYERAYASMLAWEGGSLARDLVPLLGTFEGTTLRELDTTAFKDEVLKNVDVRALRDSKGNLRLMYGFLHPTILAIAIDVGTWTELLARFTSPSAVIP